jgi:hypothetical protein
MKGPSNKLDQRLYGPYPVTEQIGTQAYCFELLKQAGSIHNIPHILLLELYLSDGRTAPGPLLPIKIDGKEEYELEKILHSKHKYGTLHYCLMYKGYLVEQSKWLPAENLSYAQDMVCKIHALHPNQSDLVSWMMCKCPGAGRPNAEATRTYVTVARSPMLTY